METENTNTSTTYERLGLDEVINLSDGHARQPLTSSQQAIILRLPEIFRSAQQCSQVRLEDDFIDLFFALAGQRRLYDYNRYLQSYAASSSISMVVQYINRHHKTVSLIEPVFDNVSNMLKHSGTSLTRIPEWILEETTIPFDHESFDSDVIWIVIPNNPTGFVLNERSFEDLTLFCKETGKTLVVDFCFRFYSDAIGFWDQYRVLNSSGVTFVAIEDTGKTWPLLDMKVGTLVCSDDLFDEFAQMHDDLLLNVSPFHLAVLAEFFQDTQQYGLDIAVRFHVRENKRLLRRTLAQSILRPIGNEHLVVPVEWIHIDASCSGEDLWSALHKHGIHILPGSNFFWSEPSKGRSFIRIPLARPPACIIEAVPKIRSVAEEISQQK